MEDGKSNKEKMFLFQKEIRQDPVDKQICSAHPYRQKIKIQKELLSFNDTGAISNDIKEVPDQPEKNMPPYSIPE